MAVKISDGANVVAEGDDRAEAMVRLKDAYAGGLFYPMADGTGVHVRPKNADGEYPDVVVLTIEETV